MENEKTAVDDDDVDLLEVVRARIGGNDSIPQAAKLAPGATKAETDEAPRLTETAKDTRRELSDVSPRKDETMTKPGVGGVEAETDDALILQVVQERAKEARGDDNMIMELSGPRSRQLEEKYDAGAPNTPPFVDGAFQSEASAVPEAPRLAVGARMERLPRAGAYSASTRGLERRDVAPLCSRSSEVLEAVPPPQQLMPNLTTAHLVEEEATPEATLFDVEAAENQAERKRAEQQKAKYGLLGIVLLSLLAGGLSLGFGLRGKSEDATEPSAAPSAFQTVSPTIAVTSPLALLALELPQDTQQRILSPSTPQGKAWEWLNNDNQNLSSLPDWKIVQRFAMATFFYSFEGEHWYQPLRDRWMIVDEDECLWYSAGTSAFLNGAFVQHNSSNPMRYRLPCNQEGKLETLEFENLQLEGFSPGVPPEITLLTSMTTFGVLFNSIEAPFTDIFTTDLLQMANLTMLLTGHNSLTGTLPTQVGLLTNLQVLEIQVNSITGPIPSELGVLTALEGLSLEYNAFTGTVPTELGAIPGLRTLWIDFNSITGAIPSELGLLSDLLGLSLAENSLSGFLPTALGLLSNLEELYLFHSSLIGPIPSELGLLSSLFELALFENDLTGAIPSELGLLGNLLVLFAYDNLLTGTIPVQLGIATSLWTLNLEDNDLSGTVPDDLCAISEGFGIFFDCKDQLCGCCWCQCSGINKTNINETLIDNACETPVGPEWPGLFPKKNETNAVAINIYTDSYPEETRWEWSHQTETGEWKVLDASSFLSQPNALHSYTKPTKPETLYKLEFFDFWEGTCCFFGFGWFSITNSTLSPHNYYNGTVVWGSKGDSFLNSSMAVLIWVDKHGHSSWAG